MRQQSGFTIHEMLVSLAIMSMLAAVYAAQYRSEVPSTVAESAAFVVKNHILAYEKFRSEEHRNPLSVDELTNSEFYHGKKELPWGAKISGTTAAGAKFYEWAIPTTSEKQAKMVAGLLREYGASASGSFVSLKTPISTIEVVADEMLCRRDIGVADCNKMYVDLDVGNQSLLNAKEISGLKGDIKEVFSEKLNVGILSTTGMLKLGNNSITYSDDTIQFNSGTVLFSGNVSLDGDLDMKWNNIHNINDLTAIKGSFETLTSLEGNIKSITGDEAIFNNGSFKEVVSDDAIFGHANINYADIDYIESLNIDAINLSAKTTTTVELNTSQASGTDLTLSGLLNALSVHSDYSDVGVATSNKLDVLGTLSADIVTANQGNYGSVSIGGHVSGGSFTGGDFVTAVSSLNQNALQISSNTAANSRNASENSYNQSRLNSLSVDVNNNSGRIDSMSRDVVSNRNLANQIAQSVSEQNRRISGLESRASSVEQKAAALENQFLSCQSGGGCAF